MTVILTSNLAGLWLGVAVMSAATSSLISVQCTSVVIVNESVTVDIVSGEGVTITIGTGVI